MRNLLNRLTGPLFSHLSEARDTIIQVYKTNPGASLLAKGQTFQQPEKWRKIMTYGRGRTYKKVEVIGVSSEGIEGAIQQAVSRAQQSLDKLSWFEVEDIRGHIGDDGKVNEYQVIIKVAFELK